MAIRDGTGTPAGAVETQRELFERIIERCRIVARKALTGGSQTLKNGFVKIYPPGEGQIRPGLYLEYYWAVPYHDGHKPVRPLRSRKVVFFGNIRKDPRQGYGKNYPKKESERVRFSQAQFYEELRKNRRRRNPQNIMRVTNRAGASKPRRFFEEGMAGILEDIAERGNLIPTMNRHVTIGLPAGSEVIHIVF